MARIPCRGCKKMIPMSTRVCPYCKTTLKGHASAWPKVLMYILLAMFVVSMFATSRDYQPKAPPEPVVYDETKWHPVPKDSEVRNRAGGSVYQVEWYLERTLKDPESYEGIEWSRVVTKLIEGERRYAVRHKYRAKNSFGGYVVEEVYFVLNGAGDVLSAVKM